MDAVSFASEIFNVTTGKEKSRAVFTLLTPPHFAPLPAKQHRLLSSFLPLEMKIFDDDVDDEKRTSFIFFFFFGSICV